MFDKAINRKFVADYISSGSVNGADILLSYPRVLRLLDNGQIAVAIKRNVNWRLPKLFTLVFYFYNFKIKNMSGVMNRIGRVWLAKKVKTIKNPWDYEILFSLLLFLPDKFSEAFVTHIGSKWWIEKFKIFAPQINFIVDLDILRNSSLKIAKEVLNGLGNDFIIKRYNDTSSDRRDCFIKIVKEFDRCLAMQILNSNKT